jgi:hypothetical protein
MQSGQEHVVALACNQPVQAYGLWLAGFQVLGVTSWADYIVCAVS